MISLKTEKEICLMEQGAKILNATHRLISHHIYPGVKTEKLDAIAEKFIKGHKALPSFKGYKRYPYTLCISVNDVVVHGLPSKYTLKEGDIVSIDCGVYYKGYHTDSAFTYPVGDVDKSILKFLDIAKKSLYCGIEKAIVGNTIGDIGHAIQNFVEKYHYAIVRDLTGHGIGKKLHEKPNVPNFGKKKEGYIIKHGMVLAIEPMINWGSHKVFQKKNGVFKTWDQKLSAHFEHTVAILNQGTKILTKF